MTLSIVLPCFNEEENIAQTTRDVLGWFDATGKQGRVIIVNDGSKDNSRTVLEQLTQTDKRVVVIHHDVNKGYGAAITTGCDNATTDLIGFMDSDGQFLAADFDKLLPSIDTTPFVSGVRIHRADSFHRKLNSYLYGLLVSIILSLRVRDLNCGMKLFTRECWQKVRPTHATGALFNAEVFLNLKAHGIVWADVPVPHYPRLKGNPTGAKPGVIVRMFKELLELKRDHDAKVIGR